MDGADGADGAFGKVVKLDLSLLLEGTGAFEARVKDPNSYGDAARGAVCERRWSRKSPTTTSISY